MKNHQKSLDQLKGELASVNASHAEETKRYQQDIKILQEEVETRDQEILQLQADSQKLKTEVDALSTQQQRLETLQEDSENKVRKMLNVNPFTLRAAKTGLTMLEISFLKKLFLENILIKNVDHMTNNNSPSHVIVKLKVWV